MSNARRIYSLLERMAAIERMERGTICRMTGRTHYNHQTWQAGRNVVRYVAVDKVASLQEAIGGYALFVKLAEEYADEIIRRTRAESAAAAKSRAAHNKGGRKKGGQRLFAEN
jgi:hypothetical protein